MVGAHTAHSADRGTRTAREIALTAGAFVGVICIVAALASLLFGITPLVFRSGSMSPAIGTGALGIAKTVPASKIHEGDVVSVIDDAGTRITHRVVARNALEGEAVSLTLKGDANEVADLVPSVVTEADVVLFHVERLGYAVSWLQSPVAAFLGGLAVGVLLMIGFRPSLGTEPEGAPKALDGSAARYLLADTEKGSGLK